MIHQVAPPIMHRINSKPIANVMRERCDMDAKKSRIAYSEKFPTAYPAPVPGRRLDTPFSPINLSDHARLSCKYRWRENHLQLHIRQVLVRVHYPVAHLDSKLQLQVGVFHGDHHVLHRNVLSRG
jgi:hypothetical protein